MRNFLVEGVSCTGKTSVCHELRRRGFHAVNGDTDLAYQGNPETGAPTEGHAHEHHIWGARQAERELIVRLHRSGEDVPRGIAIDATAPLEQVVDQILRRAGASDSDPAGGR